MIKVMQRRQSNGPVSVKLHFWECLLCPPRTEVFHFLDICLDHLKTKHGISVCRVDLHNGVISTPSLPVMVKEKESAVSNMDSEVRSKEQVVSLTRL